MIESFGEFFLHSGPSQSYVIGRFVVFFDVSCSTQSLSAVFFGLGRPDVSDDKESLGSSSFTGAQSWILPLTLSADPRQRNRFRCLGSVDEVRGSDRCDNVSRDCTYSTTTRSIVESIPSFFLLSSADPRHSETPEFRCCEKAPVFE